jgi:hypothetical protein
MSENFELDLHDPHQTQEEAIRSDLERIVYGFVLKMEEAKFCAQEEANDDLKAAIARHGLEAVTAALDAGVVNTCVHCDEELDLRQELGFIIGETHKSSPDNVRLESSAEPRKAFEIRLAHFAMKHAEQYEQ